MFVSVGYAELEMSSMDEDIREQQSRVSPPGQNKPGAEDNHSPGWAMLSLNLNRALGPVSRGWMSQVRLAGAIQAC